MEFGLYPDNRSKMRATVVVALLFMGFLLAAGEAHAVTHVVINEFDQDPPGDTTILKDEWVELFNPTSQPVDVSGWQLNATHGEPVIVMIPAGTIIPPQGYYIVQPEPLRQWLDDEGEVIVLLDAAGNVIDRTLNATDPSDNEYSWQRFPNGQDSDTDGDWSFRPATKGLSNGGEPPPVQPVSGLGTGFGFAMIGIGAGVGAAAAGIAAVLSRPSSEVFGYSGYYYCRRHRVPVWLVQGGLWCPVERRFLRPY